MKRFGLCLLLVLIINALFAQSVELKNIIMIDGFHENPLLGYGIVVGLKGTGDSANSTQTKEIISRIANNFGFVIDSEKIKPKNSAVVLVSAVFNPLAQAGSRIDVTVASVFDAKSLEGGELIVTPLLGGDNQMYAVAQGSVTVNRASKGIIGTISKGAIVQQTIDHSAVDEKGEFSIIVSENLGLDTVNKVLVALRAAYPDTVKTVKNNKITLTLPQDKDFVEFLSDIYKIQIQVEEEPSVIIDSRSGIVVSGGNVLISEAAVSFKGTKLSVGGNLPSWGGQNDMGNENVKHYKATANVSELVDGLNAIGASTDDIIKILSMLYRNGNMKGRLIVQ